MSADQKTLDRLTSLWSYIQRVPAGAHGLVPFADAYPDLRDALIEARRDLERMQTNPLLYSARAALDRVGAPTASPEGAPVSDGWRVRWVCDRLDEARVEIGVHIALLRAARRSRDEAWKERDALAARLDDLTAPADGADVDVDVEEVLRLDREATPGPWYASRDQEPVRVVAGVDGVPAYRLPGQTWIAGHEAGGRSVALIEANAAIIATYRTAAPALAREVVALRAINAQQRANAEGTNRVLRDQEDEIARLRDALATAEQKRDELRLTLAAERGEPEGAPSDDWKRISGTWQRDYPDGSFATVFPSGNWFQGKFGDRAEYKGKAPTQRAAMLAADAVKP